MSQTTAPRSRTKVEEEHAAIGARLRSIRTSRGLTQTAFGEALGVSFQQVQKYESGTNRLSYAMLKKSAAVLNCPLSELVDDANDEAIASYFDAAVTRLAQRLNAMDAQQRAKTLVAINSVLAAIDATTAPDAVAPAA